MEMTVLMGPSFPPRRQKGFFPPQRSMAHVATSLVLHVTGHWSTSSSIYQTDGTQLSLCIHQCVTNDQGHLSQKTLVQTLSVLLANSMTLDKTFKNVVSILSFIYEIKVLTSNGYLFGKTNTIM